MTNIFGFVDKSIKKLLQVNDHLNDDLFKDKNNKTKIKLEKNTNTVPHYDEKMHKNENNSNIINFKPISEDNTLDDDDEKIKQIKDNMSLQKSQVKFLIKLTFPNKESKTRDIFERRLNDILKTCPINKDVIGMLFFLIIRSFNNLNLIYEKEKSIYFFEVDFNLVYMTLYKHNRKEYKIDFKKEISHFSDGICHVELLYEEKDTDLAFNTLGEVIDGLKKKNTIQLINENAYFYKYGVVPCYNGEFYYIDCTNLMKIIEHGPLIHNPKLIGKI